MIECACGCGALMNKYDSRNRVRKYIKFHQARAGLVREGTKTSDTARENLSKSKIGTKPKAYYEKIGLKGLIKRWAGHIKVEKKYKYKNKPYGERYSTEELLARKRFRNQRYKARKRNAEGSHTFGEWELLKRQYGYTCPACGKMEPEIKLTEDHIISLSKGGSDWIENIQPLCVKCNTIKMTKSTKYLPIGNNSSSNALSNTEGRRVNK